MDEPTTTDRSYPPLFLTSRSYHNPIPTPKSTSLQPSPTTLQVPLLNLQHLDLDPNLLSQSCQNLGLFRLTNHGLPPSLSARLFALAKEILSRPFDSKVVEFADGSQAKYFWGPPAVTLNLKDVNWLEGLHVSLSLGRLASVADEAQFGDFRKLAIEYCGHMARISRTLFNTMANDLNLDGEQRAAYLSESNGTFRVYRYPICPEPSGYLGSDASLPE